MTSSALFHAHAAGAPLWSLSFDVPPEWADFMAESLTEECLSLSTLTPDAPQPRRMELLLETRPGEAEWRARLAPLFAVAGLEVPALAIAEVEDRNWLLEVQRSFAPIHAGRFWLHGSHIHEAPPPGSWPLLVDAGLAFGSGEHPTTKGCLLALDWLLERPQKPWLGRPFLDVGTGSGVLAMAMARMSDASTLILATDIDDTAVKVAAENCERNGLAGRIACIAADGLESDTITQHAPYGIITANILAQPLIDLSASIAMAAAADGAVILSGLLTEQEPMVLDAYQANGLKLKHAIRDQGWSVIILAFSQNY